MSNILLIFICLLAGTALQRLKAFPKNTAVVLNQYVLYIALPAMALFYIPKIQLRYELLFPAAVAWISFGMAFVFFHFLGKRLGWSKKLTGCLILTAGLGNTSFVGIPVIQALYGSEGLETLIVVDLPGTFVVLSTVGILVANSYAHTKNSVSLLKKMFSFPPLIAFLFGLLLALFKVDFPEPLSETFKMLAATISPIALLSVGYQLKFQKDSKHYPYLILGLVFQLIFVPLVIFMVYYGVFHLNDTATKVCIIEAAMAPMITAAILANTHGLKPQLSNMMVGFGIPISFVTIGLWYLLIEYIM